MFYYCATQSSLNLHQYSLPNKIKKERDYGVKTNSIEVKNFTKKFGSFTAVDNISFEVEQGTIFAFLGPNGAGKSTTINTLCTIQDKTEGELKINGVRILKVLNRSPFVAETEHGIISEKNPSHTSSIHTEGGSLPASLNFASKNAPASIPGWEYIETEEQKEQND